MPTLAPMPDRQPADVLAHAPGLATSWWIARTKPRQEKKLARWLLKTETGYFLPLKRRVRNWRGRRIHGEEPLLSGYVFMLGDEAAAARAFSSGALAERLAVADQCGLIEELRALARLAALDRELRELPGLVEGREVELKAGPCKGMRGIIAGGARFVVRLEILGRFLEIPLDPAEVEAL